jgi:hypothetical protein
VHALSAFKSWMSTNAVNAIVRAVSGSRYERGGGEHAHSVQGHDRAGPVGGEKPSGAQHPRPRVAQWVAHHVIAGEVHDQGHLG